VHFAEVSLSRLSSITKRDDPPAIPFLWANLLAVAIHWKQPAYVNGKCLLAFL